MAATDHSADAGNVYGNKLTLDGVASWFLGYVYGGYTLGAGNASQNEIRRAMS